MALALKDRVKETTIVVGTGSATLLGSSIGFQPFSVVGNGNTTYYCISDQFGSNWEVGIGTYSSSGNTLTRTTVLASSNGGALVVFTAGIKDVFVTYPAEKGVWLDASGNAIGLGTPAAFVGTNITGTASGLTAGNVTTNANLTGAVTSTGNATSLGSFTSLQLATALTDETGSGAAVFATSPTLANPTYAGTLTGGTDVIAIGTNQIYKDASGNVGIGVTPNANFAQGAKLQLGPYASIGAVGLVSNLGYYSVGGVPNWRYPLGNATSTNLTGGLYCGGGSYLQFSAAAACSGAVDSVATGVFTPYTVDASARHIWKNVTTELMRIDSSGNVGIGTSSPAGKLHVTGGRSFFAASSEPFAVGARYSAAGGSVYFGATDATATPGVQISAATGAPLLNITSTGNVGIGTSSPSYRLEVKGASATAGQLSIHDGTGDTTVLGVTAGSLLFQARDSSIRTIAEIDAVNTTTNGTGGAMVFQTRIADALAERMRIDSSGNLLVGTTSQFGSGKVCVSYDGTVYNGVALRTTNATLNTNFVAFYNSATTNCGGISQNGTTTVNYITSSDYRLKENIAPMIGALDKVANLNPVTYIWKDTDNEVGEGFIAHELQAICPLAVSGEKDAVNKDGSIKAQGIDPSKLVALLTASIQELKAIIDTQQEQINSLLGK